MKSFLRWDGETSNQEKAAHEQWVRAKVEAAMKSPVLSDKQQAEFFRRLDTELLSRVAKHES
ncbi:hypothetical protein L1281_001270 [Neisseria sp. HSC-16F19]|nr:hypothetical protein [Neisseria sp. HSC-16F19]MCP2040681.1 hypothetical protein [Neisseria sp. HSC-16F19]